MTKYEAFMKVLEEKGHIKGLRMSKQFTPVIPGMPPELQKQMDDECIRRSIVLAMQRDTDLKTAFSDAAAEIMFEKVIVDLDLKKDPNYQSTPQDDFILKMVNMMTGVNLSDLFKNNK